MEDAKKSKLETLLPDVQCEKNFQCLQPEFSDVCPAEPLIPGRLMQCGCECGNQSCQYAAPYGEIMTCECPVRIHLSED